MGTVHSHIASMYDIFTYIYHKNQPNIGKYITHGVYSPKDPITERQMMSKGCISSPPKRKVFRFHETILSFGGWIPTVNG